MHKKHKRAHPPPDSPQALARCAKIIDERPRASDPSLERGGDERAAAMAKGADKTSYHYNYCCRRLAAMANVDSPIGISLCKLGFVACPIGVFLLFLVQCFEILVVILSVVENRLVLPGKTIAFTGSSSALAYIVMAMLCSVTKALYHIYSVKDIDEHDVKAFNRMTGLMSTAFAASMVPLALLLFFMRPVE